MHANNAGKWFRSFLCSLGAWRKQLWREWTIFQSCLLFLILISRCQTSDFLIDLSFKLIIIFHSLDNIDVIWVLSFLNSFVNSVIVSHLLRFLGLNWRVKVVSVGFFPIQVDSTLMKIRQDQDSSWPYSMSVRYHISKPMALGGVKRSLCPNFLACFELKAVMINIKDLVLVELCSLIPLNQVIS